MHKSSNDYNQIFKKIFFENYLNKDIFLTSDNKDIKDFLHKEFPNVKIVENNPLHLGDLLNSKSLEQDVKNTLLDFYIMSKTKNAYCYSVYGGSGFSHRCSEIFDFNYEEIYYENDIILGSITFYDGGLIPGNFFPNEIQSSYSVISKDLANRKAIIRVNANIENLRPPLNRLFLSFDRTP